MTPAWPTDPVTRWSRRLLRAAALLVPGALRDVRRGEWEAELWQLRTNGSSHRDLSWFLAGVVWDAMSEWKEGWRMESMIQDVRFALRTLRRSPGFTAAAIVTLALSIGASTTLFSVIEEAVFSEPPYPDSERLVVVDQLFQPPGEEIRPSLWSYPRYVAFRDEVSSFAELGGYAARTMTLTELGSPEIVSVEAVTPSLLPMLGASERLGRLFGAEEEDMGGSVLNAVVSSGFWERRMGRTPDAVGTVITLDRLRFRVVGVVEEGFEGLGGTAEVWIPFAALREVENPTITEEPWNQFFYVLGRLAPDATLDRAAEEARSFGAKIMERWPPPPGAENMTATLGVVRFADAKGNAAARTSMIALFAAVLLVLLIATANLAGLLLARGAARRTEAAVRASLGAGRVRLARQLLTESLTLAFLGGLLGLGLATFGIEAVGRWLTESLGTAGGRGLEFLDPEALTIDWRVFGFALGLTTGVGLLFGLLPAWQASGADPGEGLRGGRTSIGARPGLLGLGSRGVMIVTQVAIAIVLLAGASVMMRTTLNLERVDLGFDREGMLTAMYSLSPADQAAGIDPAVFHTEVIERVRALPGVLSASAGEVPMGGPTWRTLVLGSEGRPELTSAQHLWVRIQPVSDGHLTMLGADLLEGRDIDRTDDENSERVVVLGRSAVEELFPNGRALGQRVQLAWPGFEEVGGTVVGVVEDMRLDQPGTPPERLAFVPLRQGAQPETGLMIRTAGAPEAILPAVQEELAEIAPDVALTSAMSMETRAAAATVRPRVLTLLLGFFAGVALFLVAVGLYGTIAYVVAQRTPELGLRASLGAGRASLLALVLRQGLGVTLVGIVAGVGGSLWATRLLDGLVFGTGTTDPAGLLGVSAGLFCVALLAAYVPARRGTRIDPVRALRAE
jgi:predicted permease